MSTRMDALWNSDSDSEEVPRRPLIKRRRYVEEQLEEEEAEMVRLGTNTRPSAQAIPQVLDVTQPSTSRGQRQSGSAESTQDREENGVTLEDLDALACPICYEPLAPPVYECNEGHLACDSCCKKITRCPICTKAISNRCRGVERIVQSIKIPCVYKQRGCTEMLCYSRKLDHEQKECKYGPGVSCPCCQYVGASRCLYVHFVEQHPSSAKPITLNTFIYLLVRENVAQAVLQERANETLFVLHFFKQPQGTCITVTCMAHSTSDVNFSYKLKLANGNKKISMNNTVEFTPKLIARPPEKSCLLITKEFYGRTPSGRSALKVALKIKKLS